MIKLCTVQSAWVNCHDYSYRLRYTILDSVAATNVEQMRIYYPSRTSTRVLELIKYFPNGDKETETKQTEREKEHYRRDGKGNERRIGLQLPGNLSMNRLGRFNTAAADV